MARPPKYSDEVAQGICDAIENGNTLKVAALTNGVSYETLRAWRESKPAFSALVDVAEAKAQKMYVDALTVNARGGDTKAIIFYLTHRHGDDWKPPKQETKVSGDPDAPLTIVRKEYVGRD